MSKKMMKNGFSFEIMMAALGHSSGRHTFSFMGLLHTSHKLRDQLDHSFAVSSKAFNDIATLIDFQ